MRISGIENIVSEVSRVFCDHSIRIHSSETTFRSDFRPRGNARQAIVDLRYGAPVSVDAGNFDGLYLICRANHGVARIEQNGQVVHMAPGQTVVLRDIRLDLAHDMLTRTPDVAVADVALSAGFSHLGRFSESYRKKFRETPSATVRRGRVFRPH
ncbi:AraC family transcriptional regulator [Rhizobium sp. C4]|uniref:AraC family transcriptional regulator n=1 Tax=Rhizobium sp. C4 TaxID=1349800 RepID=UPI002E7AC97E|nr:helix-turn-helix transcriptional regulator [Rhizobium sp. C4]